MCLRNLHTTRRLLFLTIISPPRYEADIFVTSMKWFISRCRRSLRVRWGGKITHVELITYPSVGPCHPGQLPHKDTTSTLNLVNNLVTHRSSHKVIYTSSSAHIYHFEKNDRLYTATCWKIFACECWYKLYCEEKKIWLEMFRSLQSIKTHFITYGNQKVINASLS